MLIAKLNPSGFIIQRCSSTLAEKLARVSDVTIKESPEMENLRIETETDETVRSLMTLTVIYCYVFRMSLSESCF